MLCVHSRNYLQIKRTKMSRNNDGKLPHFAPDLSRYCTTCGVLIHLQVIRKAIACAAGHPVNVRTAATEESIVRCTVCDNLLLCEL